MKLRKLITFILALSIVSSGFASCSDKDNSDSQITENIASDNTAVTEETTSEEIKDNLPSDLNYNGYEFRIYGINSAEEMWFSEELNGEVLNDAIYQRNAEVEERLNIKFKFDMTNGDIVSTANIIKNSVLSQSDDFDMTVEHVIYGPNNTLEGIYHNLYDLKYLDFEKPWWPSQTIDELTLNNKMFLGSSMATATALEGSKVVVANKDLLKNYGIDIPYQTVYDGKWTLDYLISLTKDVYSDVNGDSKKDAGDIYGYATQCAQNGYIVSCDIPVLEKGTDGSLTISAYSDKMVWLVETLYDWYYDSVGTYVTAWDGDYTKVFKNGNALFAFAQISNIAKDYRESDVNYAILPQPKYDENQSNYRTFAHESFFCVPITNSDPDRTSAVIEALSYAGYKKVIPAYYEITLKGKLADSEDDVKMLEIINNTRTISFAYIYDNWEGFGHLFSNIFNGTGGSRDYTSYYEKRLKSAQKRADKISEAFQ